MMKLKPVTPKVLTTKELDELACLIFDNEEEARDEEAEEIWNSEVDVLDRQGMLNE